MTHQNRHYKPHMFVRKTSISHRDENAVLDYLDLWACEKGLFVEDWRFDPAGDVVRWIDTEGGAHSMRLVDIRKVAGHVYA